MFIMKLSESKWREARELSIQIKVELLFLISKFNNYYKRLRLNSAAQRQKLG